VREVVVVRVTDHYNVNDGNVTNVARCGCITLWADMGEWTTSVFEDGIEKNTETAGEFDVVTGMAKPSCAQGLGGFTGG
jgi:hypothetical protein